MRTKDTEITSLKQQVNHWRTISSKQKERANEWKSKAMRLVGILDAVCPVLIVKGCKESAMLIDKKVDAILEGR